MKKFIVQNSLYLAWTASLVATLGSLYFSQVAGFPPCELCWYQRIAVFPQVVILGLAIYRKDRNMVLPAMIISGIGLLVSVYHNLLYFGIIPEEIAPCVSGVSCTTEFVKLFGFMDIPLMALLGLVSIFVLSFIYWKSTSSNKENIL